MSKQRRIVAGTDLFGDLEAAVGTPDAKRRIREIGKRFGGNDFTLRFTQGQKKEILVLAAKFVKNPRKIMELMRTLAGEKFEREPRAIREGEAAHIDAAAKKRIKAVLTGGSSREGLAHINAIPYEMRAVCYKEMGLNELAAEAFRKAGMQLEKRDEARASVLREKAGDCYRAEALHPQTDLPEHLDHIKSMHEMAVGEYWQAAHLVSEKDPKRVSMLRAKTCKESMALGRLPLSTVFRGMPWEDY